MVPEHEIKCVVKSDRYDPNSRITHVGGSNYDGTNWKFTQDGAICGIKENKYIFFVMQNGQRAKVIVANSRYGNEYLKTEADGELPNNLLSLYECV